MHFFDVFQESAPWVTIIYKGPRPSATACQDIAARPVRIPCVITSIAPMGAPVW